MRWKKLPRALWRAHPVATTLTIAALLAGALALVTAGPSDDREPTEHAGRAARSILNRPWFDAYPESARDEVTVWIWLAGGIGLTEHGSVFRTSYEIFEFERRGDRFDLRFLQNGEEASSRFTVEPCDELPPFDLCLTLESPPRGPARYYSFGGSDDLAAHVPWGPALVESARARAAAAAR
ncbi:MAG TPA: hypothetical protein VIL20_30035 [Sandaracinaceae bacterium]